MCNLCKVQSSYLPSPRLHGKHPMVQFRLCKHCGKEVQGSISIDGSFHEFSTSVYRGGSNKLSLQVSDRQFAEFRSTGKTVREIFELGLETYKSSLRYLDS